MEPLGPRRRPTSMGDTLNRTKRVRLVGTLAVAIAFLAACGTTSAGSMSVGGTATIAPDAAADLCSAAYAGGVQSRRMTELPLPAGVIRCATHVTLGTTAYRWTVSKSTGSLAALVADLERSDGDKTESVACALHAALQFEYLAVATDGAASVVRMPSGNCGPIYPTNAAVAAARFTDVGEFDMALQPK